VLNVRLLAIPAIPTALTWVNTIVSIVFGNLMGSDPFLYHPYTPLNTVVRSATETPSTTRNCGKIVSKLIKELYILRILDQSQTDSGSTILNKINKK
jgi:hypothetical protein